MLNLKYVGSKTDYEVEFSRISSHVVQIIGDFPVKAKGFTLSRDESEDGWDYKAFKTVHRQIEGGAQFSNDGSVYVAPLEPEEPEEPGPYVPTEEELAAIFAQNKMDKVYLSKSMLESFLAGHPLTSTAHKGTEGIYSVTSEKQTMMMSQYMTYQIEKAVDPNAKLTWNETGRSCEEWTEEEFMQLILEIKAFVYPLVSYQQALEEEINACLTQQELDEIVIDYTLVHAG